MGVMVSTVGHSTLVEDAFASLLVEADVERLWDVRSYPTSHWDWFRRERMEEWLPAAGVEYRWVPALGGRRGPRRAKGQRAARAGAQEPLPLAWHEEGFSNYQWHMTTEEFLAAADELAALGGRVNVAIMCAEAVWWRCHRSMIADYLVVAGSEVVHLQPHPTPHAEVMGDRLRRYDPEVIAAWRQRLEPGRAAGPAQDSAETGGRSLGEGS
jgi:uncharacterized protein (DUF488 family)